MAAAGVQCGLQQFSGAIGGCRQRRRPAAGKLAQPGRFGHLQDCGLSPEGEGRLHRIPGGATHGHHLPLVAGRHGCLDSAVTTVGHRELDHLDPGATVP